MYSAQRNVSHRCIPSLLSQHGEGNWFPSSMQLFIHFTNVYWAPTLGQDLRQALGG